MDNNSIAAAVAAAIIAGNTVEQTGNAAVVTGQTEKTVVNVAAGQTDETAVAAAVVAGQTAIATTDEAAVAAAVNIASLTGKAVTDDVLQTSEAVVKREKLLDDAHHLEEFLNEKDPNSIFATLINKDPPSTLEEYLKTVMTSLPISKPAESQNIIEEAFVDLHPIEAPKPETFTSVPIDSHTATEFYREASNINNDISELKKNHYCSTFENLNGLNEYTKFQKYFGRLGFYFPKKCDCII